MLNQEDQPMEWIKKWTINDYFTPNIKAEVILNTLLTYYIAGIVKSQCGDQVGELEFITKEMSIFDITKQGDNTQYGNMGTKIDYILAELNDSGNTPVYLVELKTTDSSLAKDQVNRYIENCNGKNFGTVFGDKLLRIAGGAFGETYKCAFTEQFGEGPWDERTLLKAFQLVFSIDYFQKQYGCTVPDSHYADAALSLIKRAGWAQSDGTRSRKYLYTMGQLLDYLRPDGGKCRRLWKKPLRLIYLTPTGSLPSEVFQERQDFYLRPDVANLDSVSLRKAVEYLEAQKEDLAQLLAEIIKAVYV